MKKICFCMLGALALVACEKSDNNTMTCGKYEVEIELDDSGEKLTANLNGDTVEMNIAPSADGARYVANLNDTEIALWNKGRDWTLFVDDEDPVECK